MKPAIGPELAQHGLEVAQGVLRFSQPHAQIGGRDGELNLAEGIGRPLGKSLESRQRSGGLVFLGEGLGDLFLHARVTGEERFEPSPDLESLVVLLGDADKRGPAPGRCRADRCEPAFAQSALKGFGGVLGLADQHERLPEIKGRQGIIPRWVSACLSRRDGRRVLSALEFEQPQDEPGSAVPGILRDDPDRT